MPEFVENNLGQPIDKKEISKPISCAIGERIIGEKDPRDLSREDFENSPELLFHGAKERFDFQRKIVPGPYSRTVGDGFYTTDSKDNAAFYSRIRNNFQKEAVVVEVLPYKAKMLDLRENDNPLENAPLSREFAIEYRNFIAEKIKLMFPGGIPDFKKDLKSFWAFDNLNKYKSTLNRLISSSEEIELRKMLSLKGEMNISEFGAPYFTDFILTKGFDGLVYNEGGDHPEQKHTTTYVFYNPEKIGTFETWHSK